MTAPPASVSRNSLCSRHHHDLGITRKRPGPASPTAVPEQNGVTPPSRRQLFDQQVHFFRPNPRFRSALRGASLASHPPTSRTKPASPASAPRPAPDPAPPGHCLGLCCGCNRFDRQRRVTDRRFRPPTTILPPDPEARPGGPRTAFPRTRPPGSGPASGDPVPVNPLWRPGLHRPLIFHPNPGF